MNRIRVKICGLTSREKVRLAVKAGADAVGFVIDVPDSPRNLPLSKARELIRSVPVFVETVAVMVPKDIGQIRRVHSRIRSSAIQVYGSTQLYRQMRRKLPKARIICAVEANADNAVEASLKTAETCDAILLDSCLSGMQGGTGRIHDWTLSKRVRDAIYPMPLILAGGLNPKNVKEAVGLVGPYAVDVSSGVESSLGVKDSRKIIEFIRNAKEVEI